MPDTLLDAEDVTGNKKRSPCCWYSPSRNLGDSDKFWQFLKSIISDCVDCIQSATSLIIHPHDLTHHAVTPQLSTHGFFYLIFSLVQNLPGQMGISSQKKYKASSSLLADWQVCYVFSSKVNMRDWWFCKLHFISFINKNTSKTFTIVWLRVILSGDHGRLLSSETFLSGILEVFEKRLLGGDLGDTVDQADIFYF